MLVTFPEVAVMFVVTVDVTVCAVAMPELLIVATFVSDERHVTEFVRFSVVESVSVAVAVNACV